MSSLSLIEVYPTELPVIVVGSLLLTVEKSKHFWRASVRSRKYTTQALFSCHNCDAICKYFNRKIAGYAGLFAYNDGSLREHITESAVSDIRGFSVGNLDIAIVKQDSYMTITGTAQIGLSGEVAFFMESSIRLPETSRSVNDIVGQIVSTYVGSYYV